MRPNCGDPLKPRLPSHSSQSDGGRVVTAGGKKAFGYYNGQSAAKPLSRKVEGKVQRLDGCGSFVRKASGLRYSPPPQRWEPRPKPPSRARSRGVSACEAFRARARLCWQWQMLDKRTTGITGLWQPSVHSDVAF